MGSQLSRSTTAASGTTPAGHPARPGRLAARTSVGVAATAVGLGLLAPSVLQQHQLAVLVAGFLVGLPHGAVDHLVPSWSGWVRRGPRSMALVLAGYVGVAVLTWTALRVAAPVVLPVLLVVSVLHFGAGDLAAAQDDRPGAGPRGVAWLAAVLARGGPVVAGPLLCWPGPAGAALSAVSLGPVLPAEPVRVGLAGVVGACVAWSAYRSLHAGDRRAAVEVVLLAALFAAVPPLAAFGVYFGAWHGLRHTARLVVRDPRNAADLRAGRWRRPVRRFLVSAALPTLVAAASAAALVVLAGRRADLTGTVFTVLLALTVPHLVVVAALDLAGSRRPHPVPVPH